MIPDQLPLEFTVIASVKPDSRDGGFLFTLTDERGEAIFFGVEIGPDSYYTSKMHISLYMSENPNSYTEPVARFEVSRRVTF